MRKFWSFLSVSYLSIFLVGASAHASETAELNSINPNANEVSELILSLIDEYLLPPGVNALAFEGSIGTTYQAVFDVSKKPDVIVSMAADIINYSYNEETLQVTLDFQHIGFIAGTLIEGIADNVFGFAFLWSDSAGLEIPVELQGGWISTNVFTWNIIPPENDEPSLGVILTGTAGQTGYFHMFIPESVIFLLQELLDDDTLTIDDLAIYNDGNQASIDIEETVGGYLVKVYVEFNEDTTTLTSDLLSLQNIYSKQLETGIIVTSESKDVSKKISVKRKKEVSLAPAKKKVDKGDTATLYGWIDSGLAGEVIIIKKKKKNATRFKKWKKIFTVADGYFSIDLVAKKTAKYKAKWKNKTLNIKKTSLIKKIKVTKK